MLVVYQRQDGPYLTDLVVGIITKLGMYLNGSQAQHMIVEGKVAIDGKPATDPASIVKPGVHEFALGERKIVVELREMQSL